MPLSLRTELRAPSHPAILGPEGRQHEVPTSRRSVGRELPVCSDLLPHHEILTGDFLRTRSLHLEAECSDLLRRGGPEGLDLEGYEFQLSSYLYGARCRLINGVVTAV